MKYSSFSFSLVFYIASLEVIIIRITINGSFSSLDISNSFLALYLITSRLNLFRSWNTKSNHSYFPNKIHSRILIHLDIILRIPYLFSLLHQLLIYEMDYLRCVIIHFFNSLIIYIMSEFEQEDFVEGEQITEI